VVGIPLHAPTQMSLQVAERCSAVSARLTRASLQELPEPCLHLVSAFLDRTELIALGQCNRRLLQVLDGVPWQRHCCQDFSRRKWSSEPTLVHNLTRDAGAAGTTPSYRKMYMSLLEKRLRRQRTAEAREVAEGPPPLRGVPFSRVLLDVASFLAVPCTTAAFPFLALAVMMWRSLEPDAGAIDHLNSSSSGAAAAAAAAALEAPADPLPTLSDFSNRHAGTVLQIAICTLVVFAVSVVGFTAYAYALAASPVGGLLHRSASALPAALAALWNVVMWPGRRIVGWAHPEAADLASTSRTMGFTMSSLYALIYHTLPLPLPESFLYHDIASPGVAWARFHHRRLLLILPANVGIAAAALGYALICGVQWRLTLPALPAQVGLVLCAAALLGLQPDAAWGAPAALVAPPARAGVRGALEIVRAVEAQRREAIAAFGSQRASPLSPEVVPNANARRADARSAFQMLSASQWSPAPFQGGFETALGIADEAEREIRPLLQTVGRAFSSPLLRLKGSLDALQRQHSSLSFGRILMAWLPLVVFPAVFVNRDVLVVGPGLRSEPAGIAEMGFWEFSAEEYGNTTSNVTVPLFSSGGVGGHTPFSWTLAQQSRGAWAYAFHRYASNCSEDLRLLAFLPAQLNVSGAGQADEAEGAAAGSITEEAGGAAAGSITEEAGGAAAVTPQAPVEGTRELRGARALSWPAAPKRGIAFFARGHLQNCRSGGLSQVMFASFFSDPALARLAAAYEAWLLRTSAALIAGACEWPSAPITHLTAFNSSSVPTAGVGFDATDRMRRDGRVITKPADQLASAAVEFDGAVSVLAAEHSSHAANDTIDSSGGPAEDSSGPGSTSALAQQDVGTDSGARNTSADAAGADVCSKFAQRLWTVPAWDQLAWVLGTNATKPSTLELAHAVVAWAEGMALRRWPPASLPPVLDTSTSTIAVPANDTATGPKSAFMRWWGAVKGSSWFRREAWQEWWSHSWWVRSQASRRVGHWVGNATSALNATLGPPSNETLAAIAGFPDAVAARASAHLTPGSPLHRAALTLSEAVAGAALHIVHWPLYLRQLVQRLWPSETMSRFAALPAAWRIALVVVMSVRGGLGMCAPEWDDWMTRGTTLRFAACMAWAMVVLVWLPFVYAAEILHMLALSRFTDPLPSAMWLLQKPWPVAVPIAVGPVLVFIAVMLFGSRRGRDAFRRRCWQWIVRGISAALAAFTLLFVAIQLYSSLPPALCGWAAASVANVRTDGAVAPPAFAAAAAGACSTVAPGYRLLRRTLLLVGRTYVAVCLAAAPVLWGDVKLMLQMLLLGVHVLLMSPLANAGPLAVFIVDSANAALATVSAHREARAHADAFLATLNGPRVTGTDAVAPPPLGAVAIPCRPPLHAQMGSWGNLLTAASVLAVAAKLQTLHGYEHLHPLRSVPHALLLMPALCYFAAVAFTGLVCCVVSCSQCVHLAGHDAEPKPTVGIGLQAVWTLTNAAGSLAGDFPVWYGARPAGQLRAAQDSRRLDNLLRRA